MLVRLRATYCLLGATAVHALCAYALLHREAPAAPISIGEPFAILENVIELTTETVASGTTGAAPAESPAVGNALAGAAIGARTEARPSVRESSSGAEQPASDGLLLGATGDTAEGAAAGSGAGSPAGPPLGLDALGVGRLNPFLTRLPETTDAGPAKSSPELLDRAREASLGMGPDGPVRTELAQATRLSRTQVNSYAVFRVTIGPDARVTRVEVTDDHSDARDAWEEIAKATEQALAGRRMRLSSTSPGAVLLVGITSLLQYPSGKTVGKPPKVSFGAGTITAQGDLSDLGAKPLRVVHTRLLSWRGPG